MSSSVRLSGTMPWEHVHACPAAGRGRCLGRGAPCHASTYMSVLGGGPRLMLSPSSAMSREQILYVPGGGPRLGLGEHIGTCQAASTLCTVHHHAVHHAIDVHHTSVALRWLPAGANSMCLMWVRASVCSRWQPHPPCPGGLSATLMAAYACFYGPAADARVCSCQLPVGHAAALGHCIAPAAKSRLCASKAESVSGATSESPASVRGAGSINANSSTPRGDNFD